MPKQRKKDSKKAKHPTEPVDNLHSNSILDTDVDHDEEANHEEAGDEEAEDVDHDEHQNKACQEMREQRHDAAAE